MQKAVVLLHLMHTLQYSENFLLNTELLINGLIRHISLGKTHLCCKHYILT